MSKTRKKIMWVIVVLTAVVILAMTITPMLLINHAKQLIAEGEHPDGRTNPPSEEYYEGMMLLRKTSIFPFYSGKISSIIETHMASVMSYYWNDHHSRQTKCFLKKYNEILDEYNLYSRDKTHSYEEIDSANIAKMKKTQALNPDTFELSPEEKMDFCKKWGRFQEFLKELNRKGTQIDILENCE